MKVFFDPIRPTLYAKAKQLVLLHKNTYQSMNFYYLQENIKFFNVDWTFHQCIPLSIYIKISGQEEAINVDLELFNEYK